MSDDDTPAWATPDRFLADLGGMRMWRIEDGIVGATFVTPFHGDMQTIERLAAWLRARAEETGPPGMVLVGRGIVGLPGAARRYAQEVVHTEILRANGIVARSALERAIGSVFVGLSPLPVPTRLFTDEDDALAWVRDQLAEPAPA